MTAVVRGAGVWLRRLSTASAASSSLMHKAPRGYGEVFQERRTPAAEAFNNVWNRLLDRHEELVFPREIIWLNGAPGSGKTQNSRFMLATRGFGSRPIVMSKVLQEDAGARRVIDSGEMVSDELVLERLFETLLRPENMKGALVDGFPRTALQVECLTMLRDRMKELRNFRVSKLLSHGLPCTSDNLPYPLPRFFVCILYVTEEESIRRQLLRGQKARKHNERVLSTGMGKLVEERKTDFDPELIAKRYKIFEQHKDTLLAMRNYFPFTVIDAGKSISEVQSQILDQFRYQSNQELRASTYDAINRIPPAPRIRCDARPSLVMRLDEYEQLHPKEFHHAIKLVNEVFVPACRAVAFYGTTVVRIRPEDDSHKDLTKRQGFVSMCLDILSERGFHPQYQTEENLVPASVDLKTGKITCTKRIVHLFRIRFPQAKLTGGTIENQNQSVPDSDPKW